VRFVVRRTGTADVDALAGLMRTFCAESGHALDPGWAAASFGALISAPALGAVWLAQAGDDAVGHAVLTVRHAMEFGGLLGVVDDLYVAPDQRRLGIARALLASLHGGCAARGCRAWQVEVGTDSAGALALNRGRRLSPVSAERRLLSGPLGAWPRPLRIEARRIRAGVERRGAAAGTYQGPRGAQQLRDPRGAPRSQTGDDVLVTSRTGAPGPRRP
jgi:GNAT superfamily N-acetyltransferase